MPIDRLIPTWHKDALCVGMDDAIFFGESETNKRPTLSITQMKSAQKICSECPVFETCLTHSLVEREAYGIWAGISRRYRLRLLDMIDNNITTVESIVEGCKRDIDRIYDRKAL